MVSNKTLSLNNYRVRDLIFLSLIIILMLKYLNRSNLTNANFCLLILWAKKSQLDLQRLTINLFSVLMKKMF